MKQLLRTLCTACLIAAPTLAAHATDYYLRGSSNYWLSWDLCKFTPIAEGSNKYQLVISELSGSFRIGGKTSNITDFISSSVESLDGVNAQLDGWDDINFGYTSEESNEESDEETDLSSSIIVNGITLNSTDLENGITLNLSKEEYKKPTEIITSENCWNYKTYNNSIDYNIKVADYTYLKHVVLTLTVTDDENATLTIEHVSNDKIYPGVPVYLYAESDWLPNQQAYNPGIYQFYRGEAGTNHYYTKNLAFWRGYTHVEEVTSFADPYNNGYVAHNDGTRLYIKAQTWGAGVNESNTGYEYCGDKTGEVDISDIYTSNVIASENQWTGSGWNINTDLTNVQIRLDFDIENDHNDDGNTELHIINGEVSKFYITSAVNGDDWTTEAMSGPTAYTDEETGNVYAKYEYVFDTANFSGAYYVTEVNTTSTTDDENNIVTTSTETDYKGNPSSSKDEGLVSSWTYTAGETTTSEKVIQIVGNDDAKTTYNGDNGLVFYTIEKSSNGKLKVIFLYNVSDSSKSTIKVEAEGTDVEYTGAESIIVDGEDAPVEYYNLSGVRVDGSVPGLYIRRQGSKVSKVIIK